MSARLEKIFRDIWDNKARSLLVIFTLAVGLAAVGMINNTVRMIKRDLFSQFQARQPAHAVMFISPFPKELEANVTAIRDVKVAQVRRTFSAQIIQPDGKRITFNLAAVPDFTSIKINSVQSVSGASTPGLRGVLLERSAFESLGYTTGQSLVVETPEGSRYDLRIEGAEHDLSVIPYTISGTVDGFVSMSTLEWMGQPAYYNQINLLTTQAHPSRAEVLRVTALVRDRVIEPGGYYVAAVGIPGDPNPGDFWAKRPVDGVLMVLQIMSFLAVVLCTGLVVNTISAVLVQQTRQVGIMRSVGASKRQIILMYLGYVLALSVAALLVSLPLGLLGAWGLTKVAAGFLNYDVGAIDLPVWLLLVQSGLGLVMPMAVALAPVLRAGRLSVYDAIYQSSGGAEGKKNALERRLMSIRLLSPPVMLSLRNTFRNKSRLAFTLATLTIAGAMFMAVFSAYSTLQGQITEMGRYIAFDASINIPGGADKHTAEREAMRLPEIQWAEGWASTNAFVIHENGSESDRVEVVGLPADARTIQPRLVDGRWLQENDTWQVVVNEDMLIKEPQIQVGKPIKLKINGMERTIQVVGIASMHFSGSRIYMGYDQLTRLTGQHNRVDSIRVIGTLGIASPPAQQQAIGKELEKRFEDAKISQSSSSTRFQIFDSVANAFNILLVVLFLVALILAVIGGLGLTGAMGLNVLERTREIGVLRAVGASHSSVRKVVVVEGTVVAALSWAFSALLSYPVGRVLSEAVVRTTFGSGAPFRYSTPGLFVWLAVVILIGIAASLAPARSAVRLTVREVLNYE